MDYQHITHPFKPVYDEKSKILILGSLPSVKSREEKFYYGHPRNRFWKTISQIIGCQEPMDVKEKIDMLRAAHIAIWDVIYSCDIKGSSDSSIRNVVPAEIDRLLKDTEIERIYANGKTASRLYEKYIYRKTGMPIIALPSTSPANAAYSLDRLVKEWRRIADNQPDE